MDCTSLSCSWGAHQHSERAFERRSRYFLKKYKQPIATTLCKGQLHSYQVHKNGRTKSIFSRIQLIFCEELVSAHTWPINAEAPARQKATLGLDKEH